MCSPDYSGRQTKADNLVSDGKHQLSIALRGCVGNNQEEAEQASWPVSQCDWAAVTRDVPL